MSPRETQIRIQDMLRCCQNILDYTKELDFEAFINDPVTIRAVAF